MIKLTDGKYRTTQGGAGTRVVSETVFSTFVSYFICLGGNSSGITCDVDITEEACLQLLERMRKERENTSKISKGVKL